MRTRCEPHCTHNRYLCFLDLLVGIGRKARNTNHLSDSSFHGVTSVWSDSSGCHILRTVGPSCGRTGRCFGFHECCRNLCRVHGPGHSLWKSRISVFLNIFLYIETILNIRHTQVSSTESCILAVTFDVHMKPVVDRMSKGNAHGNARCPPTDP